MLPSASPRCNAPPQFPPTTSAANTAPGTNTPATRIGVGIDTARYGHYAAFLDEQLQTAAPDLEVPETAAGYERLRGRFADLAARHERVHFHIRLDMAGLYADNLVAFLQRFTCDNATVTLSCGDTQRNKNYRTAVFGRQKSDPIEARACARFALTERPAATPLPTPAHQRLRQVAGRLQALVRQRTRLVNQLHQLLARAFPELAMLVKDITVGWCLELLTRYPTAKLLATATTADLEAIAYLPHDRIPELLARAADSVASLDGPLAEDLVRDQVRQVRDVASRQKRLESWLVAAYRELPTPNHLDTIPGLGDVTAAVLTAFIFDIRRFDTPHQLVAYFGTLPIEASSGFERDGTPRGPKRYVMSKRGNDLVRRYLWMAALSASRHNPACCPLYTRVRAKHPNQPSIAIGHVMRKLLHLAFAIWKSDKPFDPNHYPWQTPAHVKTSDKELTPKVSDSGLSQKKSQAAGLKSGAEPIPKEVTAACEPSLPETAPQGNTTTRIDFAHVKSQLPMARVLDHLGLTPRLKGNGPQHRCTCPIHRGDGRSRTLSVNLAESVYQCFDARCASKGDVIDLWAALHRRSLRDAAEDLVRLFDLEPYAGAERTEKRNG